ncbi:multiple monosaccharide ABC transporter substrate-binding protein [Xylanivirga thermophila]|jgi:putative multiple sugar transport system substrate-binding protein|uniref:multiple monosaccharide ABC transporter substrate-binding protein n=1 Tax=Xylanivirga thermophila TaxID=2496273 RepID=UPI00101D2D3B|nr:multiple monosaccharide ABC transporter substrate-binding protein [Xylanivirga thermophila]
MKKIISLILVGILIFSLTACSNSEVSDENVDSADKNVNSSGESDIKTVGVAMPTKSSQRWIQDGAYLKEHLEDRGYKVDLQYAEDDVNTQVSQLENMIAKDVNAIVIASIDGEALTDVCEKAHDSNIPVIAYDRLIMNSPYVDYYATFDNFKVGVLHGSYIEEKLGLKEGEGPYNIELFGGSPDDNNAYFFYDGAMSILEPYIEDGKLVVKSGQMGMDKVATLRWDGATAQQRMENILSAYYTDDILHAILSPIDQMSIGCISALKDAGYGSEDKPLPIITGQDADIIGVKSIIAGEQTQTIFKDTRILAEKATEMVDALLKGAKVEVNDTTSYDNKEKVVPAYLCEPVSVDKTNYKEILIDSGYYTKEELGLK